MGKPRRNYNQDHFKVGGSPQPGDEQTPERNKQKLTRARKRVKGRKVPPGAPGTQANEG